MDNGLRRTVLRMQLRLRQHMLREGGVCRVRCQARLDDFYQTEDEKLIKTEPRYRAFMFGRSAAHRPATASLCEYFARKNLVAGIFLGNHEYFFLLLLSSEVFNNNNNKNKSRWYISLLFGFFKWKNFVVNSYIFNQLQNYKIFNLHFILPILPSLIKEIPIFYFIFSTSYPFHSNISWKSKNLV